MEVNTRDLQILALSYYVSKWFGFAYWRLLGYSISHISAAQLI
jgi:hypothetical protein